MSEPQEQPAAKKPLKGAVLIGFLVLLVGEVIILSNSGVKSPEILPEAVSTYAEGVDQLRALHDQYSRLLPQYIGCVRLTGFFETNKNPRLQYPLVAKVQKNL